MNGLDSTYEGLKLKARVGQARHWRGLDSTYEGLKLPPPVARAIASSLFGQYL